MAQGTSVNTTLHSPTSTATSTATSSAAPADDRPILAEMEGESLDELRHILLSTLRFAVQNDCEMLPKLKGFPAMLQRAVDKLGEQLPTRIAALFGRVAADYEKVDFDQKRARLLVIWELLHTGKLRPPVKTVAVLHRPAPLPVPPPAEGKTRPIPTDSPAAQAARQGIAAAEEAARPDLVAIAAEASKAEEKAKKKAAKPKAIKDNRLVKVDSSADIFAWPIQRLFGIGPQRLPIFQSRGILTVGDLLNLQPRTYEDRRRVVSIRSLNPGGFAVVHGRVVSAGTIGKGASSRFEAILDDYTGRVRLIFFHYNNSIVSKQFAVGATLTAVGEVVSFGGYLQIVHPKVVSGDAKDKLSGVHPVYPEVKGLFPSEVARAVKAAVRLVCDHPKPDLLPESVRKGANVVSLEEALRIIHEPSKDISDEDIQALLEKRSPGHRRLAFEELFVLSLAMHLRGRAQVAEPAPSLQGDPADVLCKKLLPFAPTGAQLRALVEICADMEKTGPMGRLLQGDVGAGKTAVAAIASFRAVQAGYQVAMMAPTEILAEQHAKNFQRLFTPHGYRVELISGSLKVKERRLRLAELKNGDIHIAVGTHALLSDDVIFRKLGAALIDEQHRFGVVQRARLKTKGPLVEQVHEDGSKTAISMNPHMLVMTATPIPRTLALTVYGDLSVSVLNELPPGRKPIRSHVVDQSEMGRVFRAIQAALGRKERVYVVYPLIEESERIDLQAATQGAEDFAHRFGAKNVALLHGRMPNDERDAIMDTFKRGDVSILVSTTVIEVGVDVPEATFMIIMHAERFGLSQLHQLRGRVGRGKAESVCYLVVGENGASKDAMRRLFIMEETNDGFRIAEEDLAIRGPGDFLGTRQSGLPSVAFSEIARTEGLIELSRKLAEQLADQDPHLQHPAHQALKQMIMARYAEKLMLTSAG